MVNPCSAVTPPEFDDRIEAIEKRLEKLEKVIDLQRDGVMASAPRVRAVVPHPNPLPERKRE